MKKSLQVCLIILLSITTIPSWAQKALTAEQAADSVQHLRDKARNLYGKEKPTKQDLEQSIGVLTGAVRFTDSLSNMQLGEADFYFKYRKSDVLRDLIGAYILANQNDKAIAAFEEHFKENIDFGIFDMVKDSSFRELNKDPRFIAILNKYKARAALWNGTAFTTPFSDDLPENDKIAGLSLLWTQARNNFIYFDHLDADWNQTYIDFIPHVRATKSTLEYYRVLQKFYAQLHDGHSNVYFPKQLNSQVNSRPPLRTALIEGRVFVTAVNNDSLQKAGIVPGLEIVKINGEPVKDYAKRQVEPYQSAATPQDLDVRTYTYFLLAGAANEPIQMDFSDRNGKRFNASVPRSGYPVTHPKPALQYREIGDIGYLIINNFEDNSIPKQFDSLFTAIAKTKGLVIDIRNNGGGNSGIGNHILASFTDKPFELFAFKHVLYDALSNRPSIGAPLWANDGIATMYPNKKQFYNKPIVLLVNAATYSAAEDFTIAFDYMKRGKIVGQITGGSTGQPLRFSLPGGGSARVCAKRETYPDGKEFVGTGIKPDIIITPSINDLYSGKDAVLDKALEILK